MASSPMYNIFRHAFLVLGKSIENETEGTFDGMPIEQYGDTLVTDLFRLGIGHIETEAALITSVWMACVHELFQVLLECRAGDEAKGLAALDIFAALWIGEGQDLGGNENGHMLYNLAENAGERFGQDDGEAMVNTRLLELLGTLKTFLTRKKCATDEPHKEMRPIVKEMIGVMSIPLLQNLIHHCMSLQANGGSDFVELYALATLPRVAACDPAAYENDLQVAVLGKLQPNQVLSTVESIQKMFTCFDVTCAQVGSYLGGSVPECRDETEVVVAGYSTNREDAREKVNLDRDIKAIDIFLHFQAYGAVEDWYRYGWNSIYSLEELATNQVVPSLISGASSYFDVFQAYYKNASFADDMISSILDQVPPYNSASEDQIRNLLVGVLQYVIIFCTSASSLQYAVETCSLDTNIALQYWDTGALLYIGSMEGPETGGSVFGGELMFSTARELCGEFSTCVTESTSNDGLAIATANEVVVKGFNKVVDLIISGSCDDAKRILDEQILPTMIVPLIQGTIKYASYNAGLQAGTGDSSLAIGDTIARGILPIVGQNDPDGAEVISQNTAFQLSTKPVGDGFSAVADALRMALTKMSTPCTAIGKFEDEPGDGDMCGDLDFSSSSERIAFGRFIFHNDVVADRDASYALDVRDMFLATSVEEAKTIYTNGSPERNESLSGDNTIVSLQALGRRAIKKMGEDPMFNIYRYALYNDSEFDEGMPEDFAYAENIVMESFEQAQDSKLSAEATVVMNIWMTIVHLLYATSRKCGEQENPAGLIDSAVALWIGHGQQEGKFERGWGMYSVGQSAAMFYGLEEVEATVNADLMQLFNEAQALAHECHKGQQGPEDMYFKVNELVLTLSKPLILNMLFHMVSGSRNMMELYAVSVVPQAMACNEVVGENLQSALFSTTFSPSNLTEEFMGDIESFLRCQRITKEDLRHSESIPVEFEYFLRNLIMRLERSTIRSLTKENFNESLAGYDTTTDVSEVARLEMDIQEIKIMMRTKAYGAAERIYKLGHNAYEESKTRYQRIQLLATRPSFPSEALPQEIYSKIYNTTFVADDILNKAFSRSEDFANATRRELAGVATRTLQTMVSYDAIFDRMKSARDNCNYNSESADLELAADNWDKAVALFVGSTDGSRGGALDGGNLLFGLANSVCAEFGLCQDSYSLTNQKLLTQFAAGRDAISDQNCDYLQGAQDSISGLLATILVQSILAYVLRNANDTLVVDETVGSLYVLGISVIPLVARSNTTSAEILQTTLGNFATLRTDRPVSQIFEAIAYAITDMGVDCTDVGVPLSNPELSLCIDSSKHYGLAGHAPPPETPTNLGNGLYISTTYVQDRANIAKDVAELQDALDSKSYEMAKLIYKDGKNSKVYDENGMFKGLRSLKSFSIEDTKDMTDEPLFNFFKYALQNEDGTFLSHGVRFYADSIVESTFTNLDEQTATLPVEAILSLNLWMQVAHILYETLEDCKNQRIHNNQGIHSLDIAAAYWIGDGQVGGSAHDGNLLYALAEQAGEAFQMGKGAAHSRTNTNILNLFNEAKNDMALPGACLGTTSYLRLSNYVQKIVSLMTVPLVQKLIHNLRENDRERVKIYSYAVVPLTAGCNPEAFAYLNKQLLQMKYKNSDVDEVIIQLRRVYPCLGLSCDDVGTHVTEASTPDLQCQDPPVLTSLAGYVSTYPVGNFAMLDLDMLQMDKLLEMGAFEAAETIYTYGKHGSLPGQEATMSLHGLATSKQRSMVPDFDEFLRYYGSLYDNASMYADDIIRAALNGTEYQWTVEQRHVVAIKSMQVLVMYFGALEPLYEAIVTCENGDPSGDQWDQGAALWVGSLKDAESDAAYNPKGYFYFDLAQEHCREFGTCEPDGSSSPINDKLLALWFTGRSAISRGSCSTARDVVQKISKLLLVPVLQGALSSSIHLQRHSKKTVDVDRANAFVYSRALLPLVASVDADVAKLLDSHLGFPAQLSSRGTAEQVFSALAQVYSDMGIDCRLIGTMDGFNACHGGRVPSPVKWIWATLGSLLVLVAIGGGAVYIRHREVVKRLPENNPRFVMPVTGEMNHSMDLLEKAFSSKTRLQSGCSIAEEKRALTQSVYSDASSGDADDTSSASSSNEDSLEVL